MHMAYARKYISYTVNMSAERSQGNGGFQDEYKDKIYSSIDTWAKTKTKPSLQPCDSAKQQSHNHTNTSHTKKQHKWRPRIAANDWSLTLRSLRYVTSGFWRYPAIKKPSGQSLDLEPWNLESDPTSKHSDFFSGRLDFCLSIYQTLIVFLSDSKKTIIAFISAIDSLLSMVDCCQLGNLPTLPVATHQDQRLNSTSAALVMKCSHGTAQGFDGIRAETFTLGCEGNVPMTTVGDAIRLKQSGMWRS